MPGFIPTEPRLVTGSMQRAEHSLTAAGAPDLNNPVWAGIADRPLETIKGYMLAPYREGRPFVADDFSAAFNGRRRAGSILDFGCGIGRNLEVLKARCKHLYGYDIPAMIAACRRYCGTPGVDLTGDWREASSRVYDLTVASFVFQHVGSKETLSYYIDSLSDITDYLYVNGRHWGDAEECDNILRIVLEGGRFELAWCRPGSGLILAAPAQRDIHFQALFRTTNAGRRRPENERLFERPRPVRLSFERHDLLFDRQALDDQRGIGRVNRQLLARLRKMAIPRSRPGKNRTVPEVSFYGSIHWCPDRLVSPSVVLIHDVIPLKYPALFETAAEEWHTRLAGIARQADYVATVSQSSARDIAACLGVPAHRIRVVPNGVARLPVASNCGIELPPSPYLVYLGTDDPHKNAGFPMELIARDGLREYSLAMIGRLDSLRESAHRLGVSQRVVFYGRLSDREIGYVLSRAHALVFPSLYEGFGLPPFESALLSVPVVCSDRPAMSELLAGVADLADPDDPQAWVEAIGNLRGRDYRDRRIAGMKRAARQYSPQASAAALDGLFRLAAGEPPVDP